MVDIGRDIHASFIIAIGLRIVEVKSEVNFSIFLMTTLIQQKGKNPIDSIYTVSNCKHINFYTTAHCTYCYYYYTCGCNFGYGQMRDIVGEMVVLYCDWFLFNTSIYIVYILYIVQDCCALGWFRVLDIFSCLLLAYYQYCYYYYYDWCGSAGSWYICYYCCYYPPVETYSN